MQPQSVNFLWQMQKAIGGRFLRMTDKYKEKFFPAVAAGKVCPPAEVLPNTAGNQLSTPVARLMAVSVVVAFEKVHVDHGDRHRRMYPRAVIH